MPNATTQHRPVGGTPDLKLACIVLVLICGFHEEERTRWGAGPIALEQARDDRVGVRAQQVEPFGVRVLLGRRMLREHLRGHQAARRGRLYARRERLKTGPGVLGVSIGADAPDHVLVATESPPQVLPVCPASVLAIRHDLVVPSLGLTAVTWIVRVWISEKRRIQDDDNAASASQVQDLLRMCHI